MGESTAGLQATSTSFACEIARSDPTFSHIVFEIARLTLGQQTPRAGDSLVDEINI